MPVPTCMGMECNSSAFCNESKGFTESRPLPKKSQQLDGMEQIVSRLMQQQSTLQSIFNLQEDLRSLVQQQHAALEKKLADFHQLPLMVGTSSMATDEHGAVLDQGEAHEPESHLDSQHGSALLRMNAGESLNPPPMEALKKQGASPTSTPDEEEFIDTSFPEKMKKIISSPLFDAVMGIVLAANFTIIMVELQWRGTYLAHVLGLEGGVEGWLDVEPTFGTIEKAFSVLFLAELLLRVLFLRLDCCKSALNIIDGFVVTATSIESFILEPLTSSGNSSRLVSLMRLLRIMRALRILRFLRVLRVMSMFSALRVLIKTILMSLDSLVWSMVVVTFIILSAALLMVQLTNAYIEDEGVDTETRLWIFRYYGTPMRSSYSMFEATFSAKWATHLARPLVEDINPWFSVFWILYTVAINFAVLRVIAALFLKQTMAVAAIDAEHMALAKMKEREHVVSTLRHIFKVGDQMGDGVLHKWEFEQMMEDREVLQMFKNLELEPLELYMLYDLLSEDDGVVDQEEFLSGAMKLKNNARTVDMIQVLHEQAVTKRNIEVIKDGLERLDTVLHPQSPWKARRDFGLFDMHHTASKRVVGGHMVT